MCDAVPPPAHEPDNQRPGVPSAAPDVPGWTGEALDIGVWAYNPTTRTFYGSERARALLAIDAGDPVPWGRAWRHVHPDDHVSLRQAVAKALDGGGPVQLDVRVSHPDGRIVWVDWRAGAVGPDTPADGPRRRLQGALLDITARVRAGAECRRRLQTAEAAVAERDRFLAVAAHELRTPLTSVLAYAGMLRSRLGQSGGDAELQQSGGDAELQQMAAAMEAHAERLTTQIEQLFDVVRLQQSQFAVDRQLVDLAGVVDQALETIHLTLPPATAARIAVRPAAGALPVLGDAARLAEVVHQLLSNALKYSTAGTPIELSLTGRNGEAVVAVADRGIGIPEAALAQLWTPYYRAANVGPTSGFGIGLYVANEIITRHGGRIEVDSVQGEGSTFRLILPLVEPPA